MAKVKIYQSLIGQKHNTTIVVNGKDMRIEFSDAEGEAKGIYTTTLPEVQAGIESNSAFNKRYRLLKEYGDERSGMNGPGTLVQGTMTGETLREANLLKGQDAPKQSKTSEIEEISEELINEAEEIVPEVVKTKEEPQAKDPIPFRNVSQAQDFFGKKPYSIAKSKIRTSAEVLAKAKELGVDIIFQK